MATLEIVNAKMVRDALRLPEMDVPADLIESPVYAPLAEAHVKAGVTTWQTILDGTDEAQKTRLRAAVAFYAAALLVPALETGTVGMVYPQAEINWTKRLESYLTAYRQTMSELLALDPDVTTSTGVLPPVSFTMTSGREIEPTWWVYPPLGSITPIEP